jgi:signal transduction histidine kinase
MDSTSQAMRECASREREERLNFIMRADEIQTILAVQQAITSHLDPNDVLQMIANETRRLTSAEMSAVYLLKDGQLEIAVVSGAAGKDLLGWKIPLHGSVAGQAVLSKQSILVADTEQEDAIHSVLVDRVAARCFVVVPLMSADGPIGTIMVANRSPNSLSQHDLQLLTILAPGAVIALENARLYEQAQQSAMLEERHRLARELHDAVTQTLFSAALIADVLPRLWQRSPVEGQVRLEELRKLTRGALAEMRSLLMELRPSAIAEMSFGELLNQLCDAFTARTQIPISFQHKGECELPQEVHIALYRQAQEVLNEVGRHCQESKVNVRLLCRDHNLQIILGIEGVVEQCSLSALELILSPQERLSCLGISAEVICHATGETSVSIIWSDEKKHSGQEA